jgi:exodeoxyribonuclease VII small subunit
MIPPASSAADSHDDSAALRYEDALAELERLVAAMESSQMPLDALLDSYRRGAQLLELCRARLQAVEQQVKVLEGGQLKDWIDP